jgi:hypothetical protein
MENHRFSGSSWRASKVVSLRCVCGFAEVSADDAYVEHVYFSVVVDVVSWVVFLYK